MGKRDIRNRETKKPKKDSKKAISASATILPSPVTVEVVKKEKKRKDEEDY